MGPFGMMDLFGLNVVHDGWLHRPADDTNEPFRPQVLAMLEPYIQRGELGTKTGQGFYSYPDPAYLDPDFIK